MRSCRNAWSRSDVSGELIAFTCAGSFVVYILFASRIRARALLPGRPSLARGDALAQWIPLGVFVPYAVIALRPGPELALPDGVRWVGLGLVLAGIGFSMWAAATLGRHFDLEVEIHAGHEVVDRGPFAIVRHPVYLGLAIHFVGACLATGNWLVVLGTALVTFPALYYRASTEEGLLRERLGPAYDA